MRTFRFLSLAVLLLVTSPLFSQDTINLQMPTSINLNGSPPDGSAILDLQATDRGMLTPRMTTAQRTGIASPTTGLLVYDTDTGSFWYYENALWNNLSTSRLTDADGDTRVSVEDLPDEDIVRLEAGGGTQLEIRSDSSVHTGKLRVIGNFVSGMSDNVASGSHSFSGGGMGNDASGSSSFVGGGFNSETIGAFSFIGGGESNVTNGFRSFIGGGHSLVAESYVEAVFGMYNTEYVPNATNSASGTDRLFVVGNGTSPTNRSNVLTILKNGHFEIEHGFTPIGQDPRDFGVKIRSYGASDYVTFHVQDIVGDLELYTHQGNGTNGYIGCFDANTGAYSSVSDARRKDEVEGLTTMLPKVEALRPVSYQFKNDESRERQIGFLAQELEEVFPQFVNYNPKQDVYSVDYAGLSTVALRAVQELVDRTDRQQSEIEQLENELAKSNARLAEMEDKLKQVFSLLEGQATEVETTNATQK